MRKIFSSFILFFVVIVGIGGVVGSIYANWWGWSDTTGALLPSYNCTTGRCLQDGVDAVSDSLNGEVTDKKLSVFVQDYIAYLLTFVSIIAVIYIIWAGFQILTGNGDEEKLKKSKNIILFVCIGIVIMWLAYSIVKWTMTLLDKSVTYSPFNHESAYAFQLIPQTNAAYTESEDDSFLEYKSRIQAAIESLEAEFRINKTVQISNIQNVKSLVQAAADRLPDKDPTTQSQNESAKRAVDMYLDIAATDPSSSAKVSEAISKVATYIQSAKVSTIQGNITATPTEGNAPLAVSFMANNVIDPSGTIPPASNYIWWIRQNGGVRTELGRGPTLLKTFTEEGTYTIFLDVLSASRNSKGKTDILPLSTSVQISVKPKLGEVVLLVNGVNVSNLDQLKITPAVASRGIIFDASASRAIGNGTITDTTWNFGNNNKLSYKGGPVIERQIFATEGTFPVKLNFKTNNGQTFSKEFQLIVRDPAAVIDASKTNAPIGEAITFTAKSYLDNAKNIEYIWQIQDQDGKKNTVSSKGLTITHTFDTIGSYIVTLTAKNPNGSTDTDSKIITIESREPVVNLDTPKILNEENPNIFVFDASRSYDPDTNSRTNLSYTWRLNGTKVNLDNPTEGGAKGTLSFDSMGENTVSLTVSNQYGKIATAEQKFTITSLLSANMIITPQVTQRENTVIFIAQAPYADFYTWDFGDGSPIISGDARSVRHVYKKTGTYNARLTVSQSGNNQTNSLTRKVYITDSNSPLSIIKIQNNGDSIFEKPSVCDGNDGYTLSRGVSINFDGSNSINTDGNQGNLDYTWEYMGKVKTTPSITETFTDLGCYPVKLTVRSKINGSTSTANTYIKLENQAPQISNITTRIDTTKKDSQKVLVNVSANGVKDPDGVIVSYIWYYKTESDPEPQSIQITQNPQITFVLPNITEKYYFGVILEDNDGKQVNSSDILQNQAPLLIDNANGNINMPLISLIVPKTTIKAGENVKFTVDAKTIVGTNITAKSQYSWDFDGDGRIDEKTSEPTIDHVYKQAGTYTMKVRVTYNGVSNTKYQTITVRNELKAAYQAYKIPGDKLFLMNTSNGVFDRARWEIGSTTSDAMDSFIIGYDDIPSGGIEGTIGKLTVSNNDSDLSSVNISVRDAETILSGSGDDILFQSFPKADGDTIHISDPSTPLRLSFYGNTATSFAIDTDISIDTNLDGTTDNDIDNKDSTSYRDGSLYTIDSFNGDTKKNRDIKITLYNGDTPIKNKIIHLVLDFIQESSHQEEDDFSNLNPEIIGEIDRANLEKLVTSIRSLEDSDRIIVMQKYNTLVENWESPLEKAKSLLDIQEYVSYSTTIAKTKQDEISDIIDALLVGDAQSTDQITIATKLIQDLVPESSPNYAAIKEKTDAIASHPSNTEENRTLGKEILELIQNDNTIDDKYKMTIRDQLVIITSAGQGSVTNDTPVVQEKSGIGTILMSFLKILLLILGIIIIAVIAFFGFFMATRKNKNIGFQDFIIDLFQKKPKEEMPISAPKTVADHTTQVVQDTLETKVDPFAESHDPLKSYTPPTNTIDPLNQVQPETTPVNAPEESQAGIPDWLKPKDEITPAIASGGAPNQSKSEGAGDTHSMPDWLKPQEEQAEKASSPETSGNSLSTEGSIPDWLQDSSTNQEDIQQETTPKQEATQDPFENREKENIQSITDTPEKNPASEVSPETPSEDLPDWLKDTSLGHDKEHQADEASGTSILPAEEGIPDWLIDSAKNQNEDILSTAESPQEEEERLEISSPKSEKPLKEVIEKTDKEKKSSGKKENKGKKDNSSPAKGAKTETGNDLNIPDWLK